MFLEKMTPERHTGQLPTSPMPPLTNETKQIKSTPTATLETPVAWVGYARLVRLIWL